MAHPLVTVLFALFLGCAFVQSSPIMKTERLSAARDGVGGILVGDLYYFVGGFELNDVLPTNITEIYNVTSEKWEDPIYLEDPRGFISTAVIGQNIYFIGGIQYQTPTLLYSLATHRYEDIGYGPTVRQAIQVSNHNSTVTVLGAFSADFYNAANGWYNLPRLTSWMQSISGEALVVHENLIIGIGGVNTTTLEPLYNAWIYDTNTENLTVFENVTTLVSVGYRFKVTAANGRCIIYWADGYFAHQLGTTEWAEVKFLNPTQAVVLNDVAFVFNTSGYSIYDWNTRAHNYTDRVYLSLVAFDNQLVLLTNKFKLDIYEAGSWTTVVLMTQVDTMYLWFTKCVLSGIEDLRIYNSKTKQVEVIPNSKNAWSSILAFDPYTLVLFNLTSATIYDEETKNFLPAIPVNFIGKYVVGTDILSGTDFKVSWVKFQSNRQLEHHNDTCQGIG